MVELTVKDERTVPFLIFSQDCTMAVWSATLSRLSSVTVKLETSDTKEGRV
jgi:hypothetical protein